MSDKTKEEIEKIFQVENPSFKSFENPFNMIATKAYHQLGDISRDELDENDLFENLCNIYGETENYYSGMWVVGFGFIKVLFPKSTTRDLTDEDVIKLDNISYSINSTNYGKYKVRKREI